MYTKYTKKRYTKSQSPSHHDPPKVITCPSLDVTEDMRSIRSVLRVYIISQITGYLAREKFRVSLKLFLTLKIRN